MLKLVVELLPGGDPARRKTVAMMTIANTSGLAPESDYVIRGSEGANPVSGEPPWTGEATITAHDRSKSVWSLVAVAAEALASADHVEW